MRTKDLVEWLQQSGLGLDFVPYETWRDRLLRMCEEMGIGEMRMLTDIMGTRAMGDDDTHAVHPHFDSQRTQAALLDSTADCRFLVLPRRPAGTKGWSADKLAGLVTRDSMIGTAVALSVNGERA